MWQIYFQISQESFYRLPYCNQHCIKQIGAGLNICTIVVIYFLKKFTSALELTVCLFPENGCQDEVLKWLKNFQLQPDFSSERSGLGSVLCSAYMNVCDTYGKCSMQGEKSCPRKNNLQLFITHLGQLILFFKCTHCFL